MPGFAYLDASALVKLAVHTFESFEPFESFESFEFNQANSPFRLGPTSVSEDSACD